MYLVRVESYEGVDCHWYSVVCGGTSHWNSHCSAIQSGSTRGPINLIWGYVVVTSIQLVVTRLAVWDLWPRRHVVLRYKAVPPKIIVI